MEEEGKIREETSGNEPKEKRREGEREKRKWKHNGNHLNETKRR